MLSGWTAIALFSAYTIALFALALWGERARRRSKWPRGAVYALTACVYCSAWSFFGSIGMASKDGLDFLPIYIGPVIAFAVFHPALARMIRLAKMQNISSVADFVAARYGKAASVAATVTIIVTIASIPYIALQIHVIAQALAIFIDGRLPQPGGASHATKILAVFVTVAMAAFAIAIGTRRLDATEHQSGLMLVVAFESAVKLVAFIGVGAFVTWGMFGGIGALTEDVERMPGIRAIIDKPPDASMWTSLIVTTLSTIFFLPRQFHVSVVENRREEDVRTAAWVVPLYLVALSLFVLPIAVAGLAVFPNGTIDRDFTLLALPIHAGNAGVSALALIGAASASTSVILVATTALAVMISNDLVIPFLLRARSSALARNAAIEAPPILALRRVGILVVLCLSLSFADLIDDAPVSSIGLLSLAGVAQITPAALGGLVWRRGTARGAIGGSLCGLIVLVYTLVLPTIAKSSAIVTHGPLGLDALRPTDLFGFDLAPFAQGLIWSLAINVAAYGLLSLTRPASANERLQANIFVNVKPMTPATSFRLRHSNIAVGDLLTGVSRYFETGTARRLFGEWHESRGLAFDPERHAEAPLIQYAEHLIATSIGAASSRMVVSFMLQKLEISEDAARQIVDEAAFEIQNTREVLQHAIDVARQGMVVFDADLRLVAWNRAYREIFQFPTNLLRIGTPLDILVRSNAERGVYGEGGIEEFVETRLDALSQPTDGTRLYSAAARRFLEMRSVRLDNGGLFFTYTDATAQVISEEEMEAENMTLERRVHERTEQLEQLNVELIRAKAEAEDANVSKSRFLAAASHDLLQPLSAARLYTTSLRERLRSNARGDTTAELAANIDLSLETVEEILGALLEISHLDAGATKTEITTFHIADMLRQLQMEFEPHARERGLRLRFAPSSLRVTSDRRLLRRMLQNLISNAIKYTSAGRVLIGARRCGNSVRFDVYDTGIGIPKSKQMIIFREFERLPEAIEAGAGAGLGLSIVERLSRVLKHEVTLRSRVGKGTVFSVLVPRAEADAGGGGVPLGAPVRQRSLEGLVVAAIDNEQHILSALEALLQGWDCVVASGLGLVEIERVLETMGRPPDVIVADYHIGEIDGLAVIAALRKTYGPCPAVVVTADRHSTIRDLAASVDVRVLHKPVKPAALRSLLSQWHLVKAAAE